MTASKWTPGPWRMVQDHPDRDTRRSLAYICDTTHDRTDVRGEIATVYGCDEATRQQSANARLIAAAPELVEALRPFAALLAEHHADMIDRQPIFGINGSTFTVGDLRRARAALKSAGAT